MEKVFSYFFCFGFNCLYVQTYTFFFNYCLKQLMILFFTLNFSETTANKQ